MSLTNLTGWAQADLQSGLYFLSTEVVQDQRTALNLTPDDPIKLSTDFKLDFDIKLRKGDGYYGYIFRVIADAKNNFDLIANFAARENNFTLVFKDEVLCSFGWKELPALTYEKWSHVTFHLNLKEQFAEISIAGVTKKAAVSYSAAKSGFDFLFGVSKYPAFQTTDVCPMSLKNIQLFNEKGEMVRYWKLAKHQDTRVFDEVMDATATVENPSWLINKHLSWKKEISLQVKPFLGAVYDGRESIYFADESEFLQYNLTTNLLDTIAYEGGNPYRQLTEKHLVYDPFNHEIWSYNFQQEEISRFDFSSRKWSQNPASESESGYAHHNKFISPVDSSLVTLFGYGFYTYKSVLFNYFPKAQTWTQADKSKSVSPRYMAASGLLNDETALVFGGYGSKTGRQELSPGCFNDLYALNLKTLDFSLMQTYKTIKSPLVPAESLITTADSDAFYTLVFDNSKFETSARLAKFGISEPTLTIFQDSIPFQFLDTDSWLDLYLNRETSELFAFTSHNGNINLYSIAYPPLNSEDVYQPSPKVNLPKSIFAAIALLIFTLLGLFIFAKLRRKRLSKVEESNSGLAGTELRSKLKITRPEKLSIFFLGGFQIYNQAGEDITSDFSPMLKQLFLILFFYTIHHRKGISSRKLEEALWFDKTERSARNNRNVTISKLRAAVEEMGALEITNENSYWRLKIGGSVYCDYLKVMELVEKSQERKLDQTEIVALTSMLNFGELLPNLPVEWLDSFKAKYTGDLVDCLTKLLYREDLNSDSKILLTICDSIFSIDSINEEALIVKCQLLHKNGKGSMARSFYNSFCKEYRRLLDSEFPISFVGILKENSTEN